MANDIFDAEPPPPQQESATVREMRCHGSKSGRSDYSAMVPLNALGRWADTLSASEQNVRNLAGKIARLEKQIENQTVLLRRCSVEEVTRLQMLHAAQKVRIAELENAYVEVSIVKMLEEEIVGLKKQLEANQPAPSREDWGRMGQIAREGYDAASGCHDANKWWEEAAKAVVAAYEGQKGGVNVTG